MRDLACVLAFSSLLSGCYGNSETPVNFGTDASVDGAIDGSVFPSGLEPLLPANLAPEPMLGSEEPTFSRSSEGAPTIHLRARLTVPFRQAWNALTNPQSYRDPVSTHGFQVTEWDVLPTFPYSYRVAYVVNNIITVNYQTSHAAALSGDVGARVGIIRWQKTAGTTAITSLEGSLVIRETTGDQNVDVEMLYRVNAVNQGHSELESSVRIMFARFTENAHERAVNPNDCGNCAEQPARYRM